MGKVIGIGNGIGIRKGSKLNPLPPTSVSAVATSDTAVLITWTPTGTSSGYSVERSTDNVIYSEIDTVPYGTNQLADTGLTTGTLYYYRVRSYSGNKLSDYSDYDVVTSIAPSILIQDFDDLSVITVENAPGVDIMELSTERFIDGNATLKFKTKLSSTGLVWQIPPMSFDGYARLRYFVDETFGGSGVYVRLSTVYPITLAAGTYVGTANTTVYEGKRDQASLKTGWNNLVFTPNSWNGTPALIGDPNINFVAVTINCPIINTGPYYFDSLRFGRKKSSVLITFDDGYKSWYDVNESVFGEGMSPFSYMQSKNLKGTIYLTTHMLDDGINVTTEGLNPFYDLGWDICNHTHNHYQITTLTDEQIASELAQCDSILASRGWHRGREHFAYPGGSYTLDSHPALLKGLGYKTARTIQATLYNRQATQSDADNLFNIYSKGVIAGTTASVLTNKIDEAITNNSMASIYLHAFGTPETNTVWDPAKFKAVVDHIATKRDAGLIDVLTISEWHKLNT